MKTNYRARVVSEKKADLKSAIAKLNFESEQYKRYKQMVKSHSVSVSDFQNYESRYLSAIADKEAAESELELAMVMLDACTIRASFAAVVDKVFFPAGYCAGEPEIITISQLFPMGIKIKMDRETASKITNSTPITVYPLTTKKPTGVFHGGRYFTDEGIMLKVGNHILPPPLSINTKKGEMPVVNCSIVIHSDTRNSPTLSISSKCIRKDKRGSYVWKGMGERNMRPGKGVDQIFSVEKVYIVLKKTSQQITPDAVYSIIKDPGSLKAYDTVLTTPPANLKDGDKVCFYQPRFIFMPGDPVKVEIGE